MDADIRVGTIVAAELASGTRTPSMKLRIDFGAATGERKSLAQLTVHYTPETLVGMQVAAMVNLPPKQIGPHRSECLVLGMPDENGVPVLVVPTSTVPNGGRLF